MTGPNIIKKERNEMKKILVVDNHPVILKFMTNLLEKKGHKVLTASDGLSALEILKTSVPDVMFVDLVMPNISGEKLCQIIRSMPELANVFLIILSAIAAEEEGVFFAGYGADACIAKGPFNKMAEHVVSVLDHLDRGRVGGLQGKVIGREDLFEREITKELLDSKRHFEATLNNISEGILELTSEFKIVYANPVAISIIGISEETALSSDFTELFIKEHKRIIVNLMKDLGDTRREVAQYSPVELNGRQVSLNIIPIKNGGHSPILVILSDVSRRKKMEAQLQQAQRMESIGTLAAGVAHEINNPINGVIGYAEILRDHYYKQGQNADIPERIIKEADRIAEIVKNLLSFARDRKEEHSPVHINDILSNTLSLIEKQIIKDGTKISVNVPSDLPKIKARTQEIQQVLLNIINNARHALNQRFPELNENKLLEIKSETIEVQGRNYVRTTFYDSGAGIPENILEKICDPFFSTKPYGKGTGLGLAISHGIIKNHDGSLMFESLEGEFTKVMIDLPVIGSAH